MGGTLPFSKDWGWALFSSGGNNFVFVHQHGHCDVKGKSVIPLICYFEKFNGRLLFGVVYIYIAPLIVRRGFGGLFACRLPLLPNHDVHVRVVLKSISAIQIFYPWLLLLNLLLCIVQFWPLFYCDELPNREKELDYGVHGLRTGYTDSVSLLWPVSQSFVGVHWLLMESVSKDWTQINKRLIGNKAKPSGHLKLWLKNGGFRCLRMSLRSRI